MPYVIQEEFNVVYALGIVKLVQIRKKSMKLGMLVGIGNRKKIKKVAKMTYTYEGQRSRSK